MIYQNHVDKKKKHIKVAEIGMRKKKPALQYEKIDYEQFTEDSIPPAEKFMELPPAVSDILNATSTVLWSLDIQKSILSYSSNINGIFAMYSPDERTGVISFWMNRMHPEDQIAFKELYRDLLSGKKKSAEKAVRVRRMDDSWAWILTCFSCDAAKKIISGRSVEVSMLRLDQNFLPPKHAMNSTYQSMLENSPDLIVRLDRQLFPLYVNAAVKNYLPFEPSELGDKTLQEVQLTEENLIFLRDNVDKTFNSGKAVKAMGTFPTSKGSISGEYSFWPEFDEYKEVSAVILQFHDLTESIDNAQKALLNEQRLIALHELSHMDEEDEEKVLNFVTEAMATLTHSKHSFVFLPKSSITATSKLFWSKSVLPMLSKEEIESTKIPESCLKDMYGQKYPTDESFINNGDGDKPASEVFDTKYLINRFMLTPVEEDGKVICMASVCNKEENYEESDLRQLELFIHGAWSMLRRRMHLKELEKSKQAAEDANRVKDAFFANVSHELRTPLNGILGMLQLLEGSNLPVEEKKYAQLASTSGKILMRILSDILDFAHMSSGKMLFDIHPFDLTAILTSTVELLSCIAAKKGLELKLVLADSLPKTLLGDEAKVRQIVMNLVGNSIKFTDNGSVTLECSTLPVSDSSISRIYLCVRDTGVGISQKDHGKIFDPFFQVNSSAGKRSAGTGLGLGIVKQLVQRMNGSITVDSEVGEGTSMHCSIPFKNANQPRNKRILRKTPSSCPQLDILVAEDDLVGQFALKTMLKRQGHNVVCVQDGKEALEALMLHKFHLFITDVQMPGMDGIETVQRLRNCHLDDIRPSAKIRKILEEDLPALNRPDHFAVDRGTLKNMPIVGVTAHAMAGDREKFLETGMDVYLSKPIILEELHNVLEQVCQQNYPDMMA